MSSQPMQVAAMKGYISKGTLARTVGSTTSDSRNTSNSSPSAPRFSTGLMTWNRKTAIQTETTFPFSYSHRQAEFRTSNQNIHCHHVFQKHGPIKWNLIISAKQILIRLFNSYHPRDLLRSESGTLPRSFLSSIFNLEAWIGTAALMD